MSGIYWLASYPKSGNTWLRIFLENYIRNADKPVSINSLPSTAIAYRRELMDDQLGMETADLAPHVVNRYRPRFYEAMADLPEFRYVKTHECCHETDVGEPVFSRQATAGVVLLVRNPLDVAMSLAHFMLLSTDEAIVEMANEQLTLSPETNSLYEILPQLVSSWSHHTVSWLESEFRVLTVRYEDLLSKPCKAFADVVRFLKFPEDEARLNLR